MRNMSFSMTTLQIREQTKFVTRRFGWWSLSPGTRIQPVEKAMGLKKGDRIIKIGSPIEIVRVHAEPLNAITPEDVILEGFPNWSTDQFVEMLIKKYKCQPGDPINRIQFTYTEATENEPD